MGKLTIIPVPIFKGRCEEALASPYPTDFNSQMKYPFDRMEVGEMFFIPPNYHIKLGAVKNATSYWNHKVFKVFTWEVIKEDGPYNNFIRVWREQ